MSEARTEFGMDWIRKISKMETYNITPYEINTSIIEFAKIIVELCRTGEEIDTETLNTIAEVSDEMSRK